MLDTVEQQVLAPANVEALVRESVAQLAAHPVDEAEAERHRLAALVAELDGKIRRTVHHVVNGLLDEADAKALNAPLMAQRDQARLRLATLPSVAPPPAADTIDPDAFRTAVLQAWHDRPLEDRRQALDRLLDEVRLSPGGVKITYGYYHQAPYGPPYGSWVQWGVQVEAGEVRRPRGRAASSPK